MTRTGPSRAIKLYGTEEPVPERIALSAGPVSFVIEGGALRWVRLGETEVLRGVAFVVRDRNWGTVNPDIRNLEIDDSGPGVRARFDGVCEMEGGTLTWSAEIVAEASGDLRFTATASPDADIETNRTGFVVLHPLEGVAGRPVEITHTDGTTVGGAFPDLVQSKQPLFLIRALRHEVVPGVWVRCTMEGDTWEMEDQRNWTDANFKSYSRPLADPFPYAIRKGETVGQSVALEFSGEVPAPARAAAEASVRIEVGSASGGTMPRIGLGVPAAQAGACVEASATLARIAPQALIFEYHPQDGAAALRHFRTLAEAVAAEAVLQAVLPCAAEPAVELAAIAAEVSAAGLELDAIVPCPAPLLKYILPSAEPPEMPTLEAVYTAARVVFPDLALGGGVHTFFPELNRTRPPAHLVDFVTHATAAIVHAPDDAAVMETLEALPYIIRSARAFIGEVPYRIGPSKIALRNNAYGAHSLPNPDNRRVALARMDPRQRGQFGAAWTVGYLAQTARGGIEVVSLSEPVGELGLIYGRGDYAQPWYDETADASVYPVFHVIRGLARGAGAAHLTTRASREGTIASLAWREGDATTLWLANLTEADQQVEIAGLPAAAATLRRLDETNFEHHAMDPDAFANGAEPCADPSSLTLSAYAVACIETPAR